MVKSIRLRATVYYFPNKNKLLQKEENIASPFATDLNEDHNVNDVFFISSPEPKTHW